MTFSIVENPGILSTPFDFCFLTYSRHPVGAGTPGGEVCMHTGIDVCVQV